MKEKKDLKKELELAEQRIKELQEENNKYCKEANSVLSIMATVLDCGYRDVQEVIDMETNHPETSERAKEVSKDIDIPINFGVFVMATKDQSIDEIESELEEILGDKAEEHLDSLRDMTIDDNYCAWGGVACYGYYEGKDTFNEELQSSFAEYVTGGDKEEFIKKVKELLEENKKEEE